MLRKAKRLPVIVMLALITVFLGSLSGCGDSADPLGTATVQFVDETGKVLFPTTPGSPMVFTVMPGESRQLIVWVTNARSGGSIIVPVIRAKVTFSLLTPGNGGSIAIVNDETDGNGRAVAIYSAGNNFETDEVRVTTSTGAVAHVSIMKIGGNVGARISGLAASAATVGAYQTSTITATVTDANANPMMGQPVTFTIPTNWSDACFIDASFACVGSITVNTDASGRAVTLYRGGGYYPYSDVPDTIRAALPNGSSNALVIIRSGGTPLSIAVTASPSIVTAGQTSIITATLTGDGNAGVLVTFTMPVNNSGGRLSASSAVTDGSGNAVVSYVAGGNDPLFTVGDTVQASAGSISGAASITRTGEGAPPPTTPLSIAIAASPADVNAGQVSVVTATVTGGTNGGAGETVTFALTSTIGSAISSTTAVTDGAGNAVVTYTAGLTNPTQDVTDTVQATVGTAASAVAITRTGSASTPGYSVTVTAVPATLTASNSNSVITANVKNNGAAVSGQTVTFTVTSAPGNTVGTFPVATATTDASGNAVNIFTGGGVTHGTGETDTVTATITVSGTNYTGNVIIIYP